MGGEGFTFAALASLKNNRNQLKKSNPFRKRVKAMKVHHMESHDAKHLSKQEMREFRAELRKEKRKEQRRLMVIFVTLIVLLATVILLISGLTIF